MLFFSASVLSVALFVPTALADLYITSPVASTACTAGQACPISWNDDGKAPALAKIGVSQVGLYVGSVQTQVLLQSLGVVDVSTKANANFIVDPTVGGDSDLYFVRFTSLGLKDATNPQYPWEGFSAKFTLKGMTGHFNATVAGLMTGTGALPIPTGSSSSALASSSSTALPTPTLPTSSSRAASSTTLLPILRSSASSAASSAAVPTSANHTGAAYQSAPLTGKALSAGAALLAVVLGAAAF